MSLEAQIAELRRQYSLSTTSFFTSDLEGLPWRVFASRREPGGFQASVESGGGANIQQAIDALAARLKAGPLAKPHVPIIDAEKKPIK